MPSKRRGQALLLAVLLMVFAALLGSTFITVVALNLNQTARQEDQSSARQAATAGLNLINQNLTNSPEGEKWRPEMLTPPPAPGDPDYNFYYTAVDRAQGWARNFGHVANWPNVTPQQEWDWIEQQRRTNSNNIAYVKFPDPRTATQTANTPTFLAEVRPVTGDSTKRGMLQVSVIGLSENNEAVFERRVALKGGYAQNPLTAAARSVTNWDFVNNVVPEAQVSTYDPATRILVLKNVKGRFPLQPPYYVSIADPSGTLGGGRVRGAAVTAISNNTLTLTPIFPTGSVDPQPNERIELAAGLGAPAQIDYNNDKAPASASLSEAVRFHVSTPAATTPGAVWVNGSLLWFGSAFTTSLRSSELAATAPIGKVKASGLVARMALNEQVQVSGVYKPVASNGTMPARALALNSLAGGFPGNWQDASNVANLTESEKDQLVSDGLNRLRNDPSSVRQTANVTPPKLDTGRYRQLTKFSLPNIAGGTSQASLYGYGQGIYINNPEDVERVFDTNRVRQMRLAELRNLWRNNTTASRYYRLGTPAARNTPQASLEEQHLRGWIGPDEFRGRGALIELFNDPADSNRAKIAVTLESRLEGVDSNKNGTLEPSEYQNNQGPAPSKGWRSPTGAPEGNGTVFHKVLPWPANGTIFAEGNLRIRGEVVNAPNSLTIVSMNNIYIEESLTTAPRKAIVMARNNVVLNPTRVLGRPDAQTQLRTATTGSTTVLDVHDAGAFNVGDWIKIDITGTGNDPTACVTAVNRDVNGDGVTTDGQLTLSQSLNSPGAPAIVRIVDDPLTSTNVPFNQYANRLEREAHVLQRRFIAPTGTPQVRLGIKHGGELIRNIPDNVDAFQLKMQQRQATGTQQLIDARLSNKLVSTVDPRTSIIQSAQKSVRLNWTETDLNTSVTVSGFDVFPGGRNNAEKGLLGSPADEDAALNYRMLENPVVAPVDAMNDQMINIQSIPNNWQYLVTQPATNPYLNTTPRPIPSFFLASLGNRHDFGAALTPDFTSPLWPLNATPPTTPAATGTAQNLRMATSVVVTRNAADSAILSRNHPATGALEAVKQFGFNPLHGAGFVGPLTALDTYEDVQTSDHYFYNNANNGVGVADNMNFSLDSRIVDGTPATGMVNTLAFRFNPAAMNFFNFTNPAANPPRMPHYRLSRVKLENFDQWNGANFEKITPGRTINVNAYIYAQEGSWFVIPGSYFDTFDGTTADRNEVRTDRTTGFSFVDYDSNYSSTNPTSFELGEVDFDRDGTISREEQAAVHRFRRYNYQINFNGTIMENRTAIVRSTFGLPGEVEDWMDKWATVNVLAGNFPAGTFSNASMNTEDANTADPDEYGNLTYRYDPAAAMGFFDLNSNGTQDAGEAIGDDPGFHPPVMPGYEYSG